MADSNIKEEILGVKNDDIDWFLRDSNVANQSSKKNTEAQTLHPSPHLSTTISNSNDHISSKSKPSIGTIQEGEVLPPKGSKASPVDGSPAAKSGSDDAGKNGTNNNHENVENTNNNGNNSNNYIKSGTSGVNAHDLLNRKRSNSISSVGSNGSSVSGGGFFNRLKEKFHKSPPNSPSLSASGSNGSNGAGIFKDNYHLNKTASRTESVNSLPPNLSLNAPNLPQQSMPSGTLQDDPKLEEYVKFYSKPISRSNSRKSSFSEGCLMNPIEKETTAKSSESESASTRFSSFLRRKSSSIPLNTNSLPSVSMATEYNRRSHSGNPDLSSAAGAFVNEYYPALPNNIQHYSQPSTNSLADAYNDDSVLPEFKDLKPLKRVAFHSSTFLIDPPQQIPSRSPRKGNVEVLPNGTLKINPLTEQDKIAIEKSQLGQGGGITVGGSGTLHHLHGDENNKKTAPSTSESDDANSKNCLTSEGDEKISKLASKIAIDKPMAHAKPLAYTVPSKNMALDVMYTRCCHLREILPIPAIIKQIPKNSMAPIPILQLKNPTPTMVEIQTFADFIRIAPIICISLDGVHLSLAQFRILLGAMAAKTQLEKLSLRNTPINSNGWPLLCWFLSRNRAINKLDITQCPSLTVNIFKKKKRVSPNDKTKKLEEELVRMECNKENRSDMDWSLFIASIIARGGIEELILTGCSITDLDLFEKLIKLAVSIKTNRLGMAYNNLNGKHLHILLEYWMLKRFVRGVDLGYNHLLSVQFLKVLNDVRKAAPDEFDYNLKNSPMGFISLNSSDLVFNESFRQVFESFLMKLPNLKYLDLSSNSKLFNNNADNNKITSEETGQGPAQNSSEKFYPNEEIIEYFASKVPLFPKLIRLHFENNNLSSKGLIAIANVLPFCKNLAYFSVLGNKLDASSGFALVQAVKNSKTLITLEGDFNELPTYFKEALGVYTMRNMETTFYQAKSKHNKEDESKDDSADENNLTNQLYEILELKANQKLDINSEKVQNFVKKATQIQYDLKKAVDGLNDLQLNKELTLEGKETLVRLIFIDLSISRALKLIDSSFGSEDLSKFFTLSENMNGENSDDNTNSEINNIGIPENNNVPFSKSPTVMSRTSSRTSLNQLDKEEGSVHKLNNTLNGIDLHSAPEIFGNEDISGEDIRKKISNVDLDQLQEILKLVKKLKNQGIEVAEMFKDIKNPKENDNLNIGYITEKLKSMSTKSNDLGQSQKTGQHDYRVSNGGGSNGSQNSDSQSEGKESPVKHNGGSSTGNSDTGENINELYDQVLHDIK